MDGNGTDLRISYSDFGVESPERGGRQPPQQGVVQVCGEEGCPLPDGIEGPIEAQGFDGESAAKCDLVFAWWDGDVDPFRRRIVSAWQ